MLRDQEEKERGWDDVIILPDVSRHWVNGRGDSK